MELVLGMIYSGFYFQLGKKEVFIITDKQRKTQNLLSAILRKLELPDNPDTRKELDYWLMPACIEKKHCPETKFEPAHDYYNIFGKNFSGFGSDNVNDEKTIIYTL